MICYELSNSIRKIIGLRCLMCRSQRYLAIHCKLNIRAKHFYAFRLRARQVNIGRQNGADQLNIDFRTSNCDIEPTLTARFTEWSKYHRHRAIICTLFLGPGISNTKDDSISFITLNIFKILNKELIFLAFSKEFLVFRISFSESLDFQRDGLLLLFAECNNTQRALWITLYVIFDQVNAATSFENITVSSTTFKIAILNIYKFNTGVWCTLVTAWEGDEIVSIDFLIRERNQMFMLTSVMPK